MPADADLLCEYYISSNLKTKSITNTTNNSDLLTSKLQASVAAASNSTATNIDFVKYDKNPMDLLKSKYQLLNSSIAVATSSHTVNTLAVSNGPTTSSTSNTNTNSNEAQTNLNVMFKNAAWLDLNWSKIRKIGIGLLNLGNNCYLNATLQCLAYTPPLSQWLVAKPHSPSCKFKQSKGFCSLCEVERIIYDIFNSGNGCAKPNTLCFNIKKISNVFGVGTQEDASEFFTTLLESMAKSIKFAINPHHAAAIAANNRNGSTNANNKRTTTILDDIFSFQFRSRITCANCNRVSDTIENTNTWPVDVKYVQDVRKGMLHFLREEVLDGENAYRCDKCKKKTRATKKYSIRTAPNVLVVHLKRFDFSYGGKLSHYVTYPEMLSLKTFIPETNTTTPPTPPSPSNETHHLNSANIDKALRNVSYKLYGVLVHLGNTSHSGHYYSYVRGPNDVWYKADDQRISTVQSRDALGQNAYILFYNRISTPSSSSPETSPNIPLNHQPKYIPQIIKSNDTTPVSNYLNTLNNVSPSTSSSSFTTNQTMTPTVPKIIIKFKSPTTAPVYGPQLPPNLNSKIEKPAKLIDNGEKLIDQLLNLDDLKKLKKKIAKFNLKKLKRIKQNIDSDLKNNSDQELQKKRQRLRKILIKEKKKKVKAKLESKKIQSTIAVPLAAEVNVATVQSSTKRKRSTEEAANDDNNDNSSLCSLSSLSSSFSSTCSSNISQGSSGSLSSTSSSLSCSDSTNNNNNNKKKKKKNNKSKKLKSNDPNTDKEVNSLSLLKQYHSFSSPSPSPTDMHKQNSLQSPLNSSESTSLSISSMSQTSINSTPSSSPKSSSLNNSSNVIISKETQSATVYSYNPTSKIPSILNTNISKPTQENTNSLSKITNTNNNNLYTARNVFDEIKETTSTLKKWNNEQSDLNTINKKNDVNHDNHSDDYDEEFDKPKIREPKLKFNNSYNNVNNKFGNNNHSNSFHNYTHRIETNNTYNNNWNNHKKYNNYSNNNNNHKHFNNNRNSWGGFNRNSNNNGNSNRFNKPYNVFHRH